MVEKIKETRSPYAGLRIHRTDILKKIGFGKKGHHLECKVFYQHAKKNGYKVAMVRKGYMMAYHFREVNKGYPRGFYSYRTFKPIEQAKRFGKTQEEREKRVHVSDIEL